MTYRTIAKRAYLLLRLVLIAQTAHGQSDALPPQPSHITLSSDAQSSSQLPPAPTPARQPATTTTWPGSPTDSYLVRAGWMCGAGASNSQVSLKPTVGCGAGITFLLVPVFFEFGVMGPQANRSDYSGYFSIDGSIPLWKVGSLYFPSAIVGYSRLFETGHALDYGLALSLPKFGKRKPDGTSMRIELRDYWTFANPTQHNVMLRIGSMGIVAD